jgi:DNA gyrase subunit A
LNNLYKNTPLQQNFGIIMLALVDGKPRVLNLKEMLQAYLAHQKEIIERRTRFDLDKAEKRAHIIEGLRIALDNLDAVIKLIRASRTTEDARRGLMAAFDLSEAQAQSILDMRLQKLTGLEREKLEEEYLDLIQKIAYYKEVLANERLVYEIIRSELRRSKKHGDPRRTQIVPDESEIQHEDLIAEENVLITLTHQALCQTEPSFHLPEPAPGREGGQRHDQPAAEGFCGRYFCHLHQAHPAVLQQPGQSVSSESL